MCKRYTPTPHLEKFLTFTIVSVVCSAMGTPEAVLTPAGLALARSMLEIEWGSRGAVLDAMTFAALTFGTDDAGYVWIGLEPLADWIGVSERTARARVKALADLEVIEWIPGVGKRSSRLRPLGPARWRVRWRPGCSAELAERRCVELGLFHVEPDPESLLERAPGSALYREQGRAPGGAVQTRRGRAPGGALYRPKGAHLGARSTGSTGRAPGGALYAGRELPPTTDDTRTSPSLGNASEGVSFDQSVTKGAGRIAAAISAKATPLNGQPVGVYRAPFEQLCHLVADHGPEIVPVAVAWVDQHHAPGDGAPRWVINLTRAMSLHAMRSAGEVPEPAPRPVHPTDVAEARRRAELEALGEHDAPPAVDPAVSLAIVRQLRNQHNKPPEVGTP